MKRSEISCDLDCFDIHDLWMLGPVSEDVPKNGRIVGCSSTVEATNAIEIDFDIKERVSGGFSGYVLNHVEPQGGVVTICGKV